MKSKAFNMFRNFGKYGLAGLGLAATVAGTAAVVSADSDSEFPVCRAHIPTSDFPPFRKWNFNWDRMEPLEDGPIWPNPCQTPQDNKIPKCRRNLILIRHGQYLTAGNDDCEHTLSCIGQEQAAITGKKLDQMGIKFKSITCSGLTRAIQTANIIMENMECSSKSLNLRKDPLLNEGTPCVPEPPYRNLDIWNPTAREIATDSVRVETAFRKYIHRADKCQEEDSWEIIVCHSNVIRYFVCRALQFPPEGWLRISLDHCSLTRLTILPSGEVILRGLGDSGHIPDEKNTALNA